ncbi:hypothetical protein BGX28_006220 [Mortierella sp. GBA30]|nr:hypothetical protein BGX28_006220 [Mortierella sp. GBA30]
MDDSLPASNTGSFARKTISTSTSTSTSGSGFGMQRERDDDDDDITGPSLTEVSEPPKKRLRSTASMLLDAAVETVIFTGAVALSAYQLLTGKGKLGGSDHSKQSSSASDEMDESREGSAKTQDEDPMEEKLALVRFDILMGAWVLTRMHQRKHDKDTDEAFLRMEAQLNNLIAEGKKALNSRIEVWDEE